MAAAAMPLEGDPAAYATVEMRYRSPAYLPLCPPGTFDSNAQRATIPSDLPGAGTPTNEIKTALTPVVMLDGRKLLAAGERPHIDRHGFIYAQDDTAFRAWSDPAAVRDEYLPEIEALVRREVPGMDRPGSRVLIFDHALRTGGQGMRDEAVANPDAGWGPYANLVHTDATARSIHSRCKDQVMGTTETEVKYDGVYPACWGEVRPTVEWQERLFRAESQDHDSPSGRGGEHMILNVWRPIADEPTLQWGLAALDGSTMPEPENEPSILIKFDNRPGGGGSRETFRKGKFAESKVKDVTGAPVPVRIGETLTPLHSPEHRWIFFPQQTRDEVLLLKVFDSRRDGRTRACCHSAFKDPTAPADAHRRSIEVRCLCILAPDDEDSLSGGGSGKDVAAAKL